MIPKILHQVWLGDKPLPDRAAEWMPSWREHHPEWQHHLWRTPPFTLINQHEYETAKHPAQQADILRYELLFHFGGVYVDIDTECLQPFDPLLGVNAFAGYERAEDHYLCNAVLGSKPRGELMRLLIRKLPDFWNRNLHFFQESSPVFFSTIAETNPELLVRHPEQFFYPFRFNEPRKDRRECHGSFAIHHWQQSWLREPS